MHLPEGEDVNTWVHHICKGLMVPEQVFLQIFSNRLPPGVSGLGFLARSRVFTAQIPCSSMPPVTRQTIAPAGLKSLSKSILQQVRLQGTLPKPQAA